MSTEAITTRLSRDQLKVLEEIAKIEKIERSTALRKLIEIGAQEWLKKRAIELYRQRKVTLWKASEIAGVTLREMMEMIAEEKIPLHYTADDLEDDLKTLEKELRAIRGKRIK